MQKNNELELIYGCAQLKRAGVNSDRQPAGQGDTTGQRNVRAALRANKTKKDLFFPFYLSSLPCLFSKEEMNNHLIM